MMENFMDNEENIDDLIEKVRNSWGWGKPGPAKNPEFEIIYRCLRYGGLEKYTKLEYPYTREELDASDNLAAKVSMTAGIWAVKYVDLYKSNITRDYKAEIKIEKPKNFEFQLFKEKIYRDVPGITYMYNSKAFVTDVKKGNKYAYVKADLLVEQGLRLANTLDFINKNPNKVDLIADLNYN
ncbi:MAG: hypothetical protein KKF74_01585 [Nanoarchaeota archaeon]|nr:hypothetical protein [Nanoarchaeota archaeon]